MYKPATFDPLCVCVFLFLKKNTNIGNQDSEKGNPQPTIININFIEDRTNYLKLNQ